jgi:hypothetical protein
MRVKEIIEQAVAPEEDVELDARDLFEMANLYPDTTACHGLGLAARQRSA